MSELAGALTSTKAIVEMLRGAATLIKDVDIKMAVFDAVSKAVEVQTELLQANEEISSLRQQINDLNDWKERSAKYKLVKIEGAVIYQSETGDPEHFACPNCFEKLHQIHPLQFTDGSFGSHECSGCQRPYPLQSKRSPRGFTTNTKFDPRRSAFGVKATLPF